MNAVQLIKALETTSSTTAKEKLIMDAFALGEREFFAAARFCLDPTVSFGIKKVTLIEEDYPDGNLNFSDFMLFANRLRKRELTGNAAISAMHAAAERTSSETWNTFYRRVLLKDFKAGFDHSTLNKVLNKIDTPEAKQYLVPVFSCQLAKDSKEHPKKMVGKKLLDLKLNGVRLLTLVDINNKTVTQFTRNGNLNENFPHLRAEFEKLIPHLPASMVFDGEVVGRTFQELMSQLNRGTDANTEGHKLSLFDIVPLNEFRTGKCAIPQRKRHEALCDFLPVFQQESISTITILPKIEVDLSTPEGNKQMLDFWNEVMAAARENGEANVLEGIMIKDPEAPYVSKKGTNWLKKKPSLTVDLEVVGLERGKADGKYHHTLGALVCRGVDDGKLVSTNVATGLTDEERDFFWNNPDEIMGYIVEVEADELTQNADMVGTNEYSLRFPRYVSRRGLKPGDKI